MAGSYPDVPDLRMGWDRDGSVGFKIEISGSVVALTATELQELNDEDTTSVQFGQANPGSAYGGLIFPELRDLSAYFLGGAKDAGTTLNEIATSTDTTTGADGTWTTRQNPFILADPASPNYRSFIQTLSVTGIKALRFHFTGSGGSNTLINMGHMHFYGKPSSGEQPNRLRGWHATLNQEIGGAAFDFGDAPRGTTDTRTFRIKNNSSTLTAVDVRVTREALTNTTPDVVAQHELSDDGVTWGTTILVGDLAPGAISGVLHVRRSTLSNAAVSVWALRVVAQPSSWVT